MKTFEINEEYLTSVTIRKDYTLGLPEDERILLRLRGHKFESIGSEDHPEFTKLREQLGEEGYIQIERGWSNGDIVVKPFMLNGEKFKKGDKFVCAPAMKFHIKSKYKK